MSFVSVYHFASALVMISAGFLQLREHQCSSPELSETPSCVARQFSIISVNAHVCVGPSSSPAARGTHGPIDTRQTSIITRFVLVIAESVHVIISWPESLNLHWTSGARRS
jgi:hypothetical protein